MTAVGTQQLLDEIAALARDLDGQVAPLAFFDADHTLWATDLGDSAFHAVLQRRLLRPEAAAPIATLLTESGGEPTGDVYADAIALYGRYKHGDVSEVAIISAQAVLYAGWTVSEVRALGAELMAGAVGEAVYEEIAPILEALARAGLSPRVISGTVQWLVEAGAEALGIPAASVQAARIAVGDGERLLGEMVEPITYQEGKVRVMERWIAERRAAIAFGDSVSDIPMLERAELRVAVNPRPTLRARAASHEPERWRIWIPERTRAGHPVAPVSTDRVIV